MWNDRADAAGYRPLRARVSAWEPEPPSSPAVVGLVHPYAFACGHTCRFSRFCIVRVREKCTVSGGSTDTCLVVGRIPLLSSSGRSQEISDWGSVFAAGLVNCLGLPRAQSRIFAEIAQRFRF